MLSCHRMNITARTASVLKIHMQMLSNKCLSAKAYIFEKQFVGFPKPTDFKLVEEELSPIKDGEFLAEAVYLSVDPYMRAYAPRLQTGKTFIGSQVAKIIESRHEKFPVGKYVVGEFGWRTHTISNGKPMLNGVPQAWIIPDLGNLPLSIALGALGMPGLLKEFNFNWQKGGRNSSLMDRDEIILWRRE
ncbi:unnamed protein product [Acanthoscelides obtectus]|uniref:15-oxoprostaglandin 13-reductase n=1 Tax=Acanthoscelides obtectus TaxID=200917 RepID=A0A9P0KV01_ACAOB|nr:unnamed protein product [Acanthoscelides obtectus]CAK1667608.1 Prostaglandin reductase 1 [Acanthoscelides obtectus]